MFASISEAAATAIAAVYRKLARECFKWAREAFDESVRKQCVFGPGSNTLRGLNFNPAQSPSELEAAQ